MLFQEGNQIRPGAVQKQGVGIDQKENRSVGVGKDSIDRSSKSQIGGVGEDMQLFVSIQNVEAQGRTVVSDVKIEGAITGKRSLKNGAQAPDRFRFAEIVDHHNIDFHATPSSNQRRSEHNTAS